MNRAEKRKQLKQNQKLVNSPSKIYSSNEVLYLLNEERKKMIKQCSNDYSAVVTLVLRDHLNFGYKRCRAFLERIQDTFKAINEDYLTVDDIKKTVLEELQIEIK